MAPNGLILNAFLVLWCNRSCTIKRVSHYPTTYYPPRFFPHRPPHILCVTGQVWGSGPFPRVFWPEVCVLSGFRPEKGVFWAGGCHFARVPARKQASAGRRLIWAWAPATARDPTDTHMPPLLVRAGDEVILPPDYVQVWPEALDRAWGFSRFLVARSVETPKAGENPSRQAGRRGSPGQPVRRTPDHHRTATTHINPACGRRE